MATPSLPSLPSLTLARLPLARLLLAALAALAAWGCGDPIAPAPDVLELVRGQDQCGMPGREIEPLVVRVLGPRHMDLLGKKGDRPPAAGVLVRFEVEDPRTKTPPKKASAGKKPPKEAAGSGTAPGGPPKNPPKAPPEDASGDEPPDGPLRGAASEDGLGPEIPGGDAIPEDAGSEDAVSGGSTPGGTSAGGREPGGAAAEDRDRGGSRPAGLPPIPPYPVLYPVAPGSSAPLAPAGVADAGGAISLDVETDAQGFARVGVRLGARNGLWNIEARVRKEKVRFRTVTGAELEPGPLEGVVGDRLPLRIWLRELSDPADPRSLAPLADRDIDYRIVSAPVDGAATADLRDRRNKTDVEGFRETELTLGSAHGVYTVLAEIRPQEGDDPLPPIAFDAIAIDWVRIAVLAISGAFVFLLGVRFLGNGFLLVTSRHMHLPTGPWARHRTLGYLGGLTSGVIFESSSLVVSHLVSFANGGLLTAAAGLGLVLGANVGGTFLPQVLAMGIGGLAVAALTVGVFLFLVTRRVNLVSWGWVFLGAGLILTGWWLLVDATSLAASSARLGRTLDQRMVDYARPFVEYAPRFFSLFALATALGFILRTSNLVVVLVMAFAVHDIVSPTAAIPIVLGANVGSALMVLAVSIPKRREARRLALTNAALHVMGCAGAIALSLPTIAGHPPLAWLVEPLVGGSALGDLPSNGAAHVAMTHTAYNVLAGLPFVFFPRGILRIVDRILPAAAATEDVKPLLLDRHLVSVPALALRQATEEAIYMTEICRKTVAEAYDSFRYSDLDLSEQVVRREEVIANIHREVTEYLSEVSRNQLSGRDASQLEILQTAVSCLVRIGGLGERYRDLTTRKIEEAVQTAEEVERELNDVYDLVMGQFANILSLLREQDPKTEENAVKVVERLAKLSSRIEGLWRQRIEQTPPDVSAVSVHIQTLVYHEAFGILFRIASHLAHIAERMRILRPDRL